MGMFDSHNKCYPLSDTPRLPWMQYCGKDGKSKDISTKANRIFAPRFAERLNLGPFLAYVSMPLSM